MVREQLLSPDDEYGGLNFLTAEDCVGVLQKEKQINLANSLKKPPVSRAKKEGASGKKKKSDGTEQTKKKTEKTEKTEKKKTEKKGKKKRKIETV